MKYALFPGCVLEGAAAEAYTSLNKVCDKLGIEIEEIPNWTCCGASHAQGVNDFAALVINARNISIAENMGLPDGSDYIFLGEVLRVCSCAEFLAAQINGIRSRLQRAQKCLPAARRSQKLGKLPPCSRHNLCLPVRFAEDPSAPPENKNRRRPFPPAPATFLSADHVRCGNRTRKQALAFRS